MCFDETNKLSLMLRVSLFIYPQEQMAQADAKENKSRSSSSDQESAAGIDVDQDYTLICSTPTQSDVRLVAYRHKYSPQLFVYII